MPEVIKHCADCEFELGEGFMEVHEWLDEFSSEMGSSHRNVRHHVEGVEEVRKKWGDRAAQAAVIHIKRDCHGVVPTMEQIKMWSLFST